MSTLAEYMFYLTDQLCDAGKISYRKMFRKYLLYCDSKLIGLVCDCKFFLKKTDAGRNLLKEMCEVPAYNGARVSLLITSTDDREYLTKPLSATANGLPSSRLKKTKNEHGEPEYVCYCSKVTAKMIAEAVRTGADSLEKVIVATGAMKDPDCEVKNPKGT